MSVQGIVLIDAMALSLMILILNLVRTNRLYVTYGVLWLIALIGLIVTISVPPLLSFATLAVGAVFPASAVSLLAFVFIFSVLVLFSVQLSTLSKRQVDLIQSLALSGLLEKDGSQIDDEEGLGPGGGSSPDSDGEGIG